jgi:hypothetical protein
MKKSISTKTIIALAITLFTLNVNAQNFYAKLNAGFNVGNSSNLSSDFYNLKIDGTVRTYENVNLSFGKGTNFGATFGYMFNKYVGSELNVSYLLGSSTKVEDSEKTASSSEFTSSNYSAKMISFIPAIVITPGFEKMNPYARFGLILGIPTVSSKMESSYTEFGINGTSNLTFKLNGGIAFGLQSALGIEYKFNDKMSFFGEINSINLSYSPTKGEMTEFKINGSDNLGNLSTREKKTEFVDSYTEDSSKPADPNAAAKALAPRLPFSSFGLNLGVIYNF